MAQEKGGLRETASLRTVQGANPAARETLGRSASSSQANGRRKKIPARGRTGIGGLPERVGPHRADLLSETRIGIGINLGEAWPECSALIHVPGAPCWQITRPPTL